MSVLRAGEPVDQQLHHGVPGVQVPR